MKHTHTILPSTGIMHDCAEVYLKSGITNINQLTMHKYPKKVAKLHTQNLTKSSWPKLINVQCEIRSYRWEKMSKINKRTCTTIPHFRVLNMNPRVIA